jgi:D-alanine-D-alanine ligase
MKNVLILKGGGGTEHDISLISAEFIESQINNQKFKTLSVEISKDFQWNYNGQKCELSFDRKLIVKGAETQIDFVIPCLHGYPGETGDIQSYLQLINIPYLGCNSETSTICFNKLLTKLFLEQYGINTTPFMQLNGPSDIITAKNFLTKHGCVYVKATNQGSSVGCYRITNEQELLKSISDAFNFSPFVIIEKEIQGRELEVSVFQYNGKIHITPPGEIECPNDFYSYEEKYSKESHTKTNILAKDISKDCLIEINRQAELAVKCLKIRHLSRIDFFLTSDSKVYINEINTFPGHTEISMFPAMMENNGVKYSDFINGLISSLS